MKYLENFASIRAVRSLLREDALKKPRPAHVTIDVPDTADVVNSMLARSFYQWVDHPLGFQPRLITRVPTP
jgi:hypothetical protein